MTTHIMIDLETMGTDPFSAIIDIGAVAFDPNEIGRIYGQFDCGIELASNPDIGLRMDAKTVEWWLSAKQDAARAVWLAKDKVDIRSALDGFAAWLKGFGSPKDLRIWGNGADFDCALMQQAYKAAGRDAPWSYGVHRCFRTIKAATHGLPWPPTQGVAHTGLGDALTQTLYLQQIVTQLGIELN